jgi:starch synthase
MDMHKNQYNVLFACSELTPWVKTGGLADVSGSLPHALRRAGAQVKIVLPGYRTVLDQIDRPEYVCHLDLPLGPVAICCTSLAGTDVLLVTHPAFSNRNGNPYMSDDDRAWPDNPYRFALFSQAIAEIGLNRANLDWQPDIVHCNDWQTGLAPALLSLSHQRPATVFTIHNLAYQGNILYNAYRDLNLPDSLFHTDGLEFWGQASFIKGGLAYADRVNTVSPGYASEIKTMEYGSGMDGMLNSRGDRVNGILNGIDEEEWNPATDPYLKQNYTVDSLELKTENKIALQQRMKLPADKDVPLLGSISRLAVQKGIDILIDAIKAMPDDRFQLAILGAGETDLQSQLSELAERYPDKVAVRFGYDESLSRAIEAGSDIFVMPSRYEPCGLNQFYSLRYGTVPLVTRVGGLADTVFDVDSADTKPDQKNGIVINEATTNHLVDGIRRALTTYEDKKQWKALQRTGMRASYSWNRSASEYIALYAKAIGDNLNRMSVTRYASSH